MAKDDYHVIVYQILSYLYQQLKRGYSADPDCLRNEGELFSIPEKYWEYIIYNLVKEELIYGIKIKERRYVDGETAIDFSGLENAQITPKGIEYLTDNSFMEKAKNLLKDVKSIVPFV